MKKIALLTLFFFVPPLFLLTSAFYLHYISFQARQLNTLSVSANAAAYAALPTAENNLTGIAVPRDARVDLVKEFFTQYKSPLEPFAQDIVNEADKYNLDFRLLPAIAMQESNLCKKIKAGSNNCWGFGIYGKTMTTFESYPQAITTVSKTLAKEYTGKGLTTPREIMSKYTPSNKGDWADSVEHFMGVLDLSTISL